MTAPGSNEEIRSAVRLAGSVDGSVPYALRAVSTWFDAAQEAITRREVQALVPAYDWGSLGSVVDVGGGNGSFLCALLAKFPTLRGVLFDRPQVVAAAGAVLGRYGVASRCTVVGGDLLTSVPAGRDAYVVKHALSGLDEDTVVLLRAVRSAMRADARLLVIAPAVGDEDDGGEPYEVSSLATRGGTRTRGQFERLLARAGFALARVVRTQGPPIVEGRPI